MVDVIDYENIENVTPEQYGQDASSANSSVPGINSPMIDAQSGVENIPEYTPEEQDITPDLTGWTTNIVRTANSYNKISWSAGTIYLADGTTYSVDLGTRTSITAITYIYYNGTSTLQTTTLPEQAVGTDKILLCVAKNVPSPNKLQFQAFGTAGLGVFITADNIASNTITANQIASNTISASQIRSDYVYAGNLNASQITAGTMSANRISGGTITGITITGSILQTSESLQRIVIRSDNTIRFYYDSSQISILYGGELPIYNGTRKGLFISGHTMLGGNLYPLFDGSYDIGGTIKNRRRDIYMSGIIRVSYGAITAAYTASTHRIPIQVGGQTFKLMLHS